jgi:gamma-glutamyltranspeptidase/glutathione hydrolase
MTEQPPDLDRFTSRRSTVQAPNGVVATSQPVAAEAGLRTLQENGNAFDAAVSTAAVLAVVEPFMTGIGGDVFALYRTCDGNVGAMRSCGGAPQDATLSDIRTSIAEGEDTNTPVDIPDTSPHAITVPGTVKGWETLIDRFGSQSLADLLEPAISYARNGFPVTEIIANQWSVYGEPKLTSPEAKDTFLPDGKAPSVGDEVCIPELADTMKTIAEQGADAVYQGEIADQIVDAVQGKGGYLSHDDLRQFEAEFPTPVQSSYNGATIYELPPNNQGLIALEALNIAEELGVDQYGPHSVDRIHYLVEALKLAFQDGHQSITDPEYVSIPDLASKDHAKRRARLVGAEPIIDLNSVSHPDAEDSDTVLLTVADDDGNVVSLINSLYGGFGSGIVAGNTGIVLQNRGRSFSLDPEHPNRWEPGKRPFHTLIPAVAKFGPDDWAAFGVMGGYMQPQGHLQVISNIVDCGFPLQRAIDAPRWRYRETGELAVEERMGYNIPTKLARREHDVRILPPRDFGGGQIVRANNGVLSAATDPRKDGIATGY